MEMESSSLKSLYIFQFIFLRSLTWTLQIIPCVSEDVNILQPPPRLLPSLPKTQV